MVGQGEGARDLLTGMIPEFFITQVVPGFRCSEPRVGEWQLEYDGPMKQVICDVDCGLLDWFS